MGKALPAGLMSLGVLGVTDGWVGTRGCVQLIGLLGCFLGFFHFIDNDCMAMRLPVSDGHTSQCTA